MRGLGDAIPHRVVGLEVEWRNPRTGYWDVVTSWPTQEGAEKARDFYNNQDYAGWHTAKISKSNP